MEMGGEIFKNLQSVAPCHSVPEYPVSRLACNSQPRTIMDQSIITLSIGVDENLEGIKIFQRKIGV